MSKLKMTLFSAFENVYNSLQDRGLGRIPGVTMLTDFLFWSLWSNKSIIEIQGSKMYVNPDRLPISFRTAFRYYIMSRNWEKLTTDMFKRVVKEGDTVLDLGANMGYFSLLAARLVGKKGKVYSFEPEPLNFSLLVKNIELNRYDNIIPMQKAVSNISGKMRLFLDNKDRGAHSIYQIPNNGTSIEVESVRLDEFFKGKQQRVNVIKMDIEGAEMAALSGMQELISKNKTLKLFVEFYFPAIRRTGRSPEEFIGSLLEDYHFSILAIGEYTRERKYLEIKQIDQLMGLCKGEKTANLLLERKS